MALARSQNQTQTAALNLRDLLAGCRHQRAKEQGALGAREEAAAAGRGVQWSPGGHLARAKERAISAGGCCSAVAAP